MDRRHFLFQPLSLAANAQLSGSQVKPVSGKLQAGAATAVITPPLGASLAGYYTESFSKNNHDDLLVKAVVLDNGSTRTALAVCDLCVLPFEVVSNAKRLIAENAGIPVSNTVISCTHTHSAPATLHIFQSRPDQEYLKWLTTRIADSVIMAVRRLEPAKIGYGSGTEDSLIFNRRFQMKPGTIKPNPYGKIDQVQTNPGIGNPNVIRSAGPVDPTVGVIAIQAVDGSPLALIGNYSLHYVGGQKGGDVSADYFAYWAEAVTKTAAVPQSLNNREFVAILTNGCQGDINNVNVFEPAPKVKPYERMKQVADTLAKETVRIWKNMRYSEEAVLGGSEEWLPLSVRIPSADELSAARTVLAQSKEGPPYRLPPEVFARETVLVAESIPPILPVSVQALRIGNVALTALSGEPFVELGLELRKKSPIRDVFPIGLANGHAGYVPTVEAMELGGYETWLAKSSFLTKDAAPLMVQSMLKQLERLAS